MKTKITHGLIIALIGIAIKLVSFLLGFETDKIETLAATLYGWGMWLVSLVILFIVLWLGLRAVRAEKPDQSLTYGQGLGAGVIIALIAAVIGAIYIFIHYSFINPDFAENMIAFMREKWAGAGMPENQINMALRISRITMHPAVMAVSDFIGKMIVGTICSLFAALIVRRAPQPAAAQVPPPMPPAL